MEGLNAKLVSDPRLKMLIEEIPLAKKLKEELIEEISNEILSYTMWGEFDEQIKEKASDMAIAILFYLTVSNYNLSEKQVQNLDFERIICIHLATALDQQLEKEWYLYHQENLRYVDDGEYDNYEAIEYYRHHDLENDEELKEYAEAQGLFEGLTVDEEGYVIDNDFGTRESLKSFYKSFFHEILPFLDKKYEYDFNNDEFFVKMILKKNIESFLDNKSYYIGSFEFYDEGEDD